MTKRRPSNKKPTGSNKSLGQSLSNDRDRARVRHQKAKHDDDALENPAFLLKEGKKNIDSVTEETSLEEFLARAELAGTEFTAERGVLKIVSSVEEKTLVTRTPSKQEILSSQALQEEYADRLRIPRRPSKDHWTTAEELQSVETEDFLVWRRALAELQEVNGLVLTPFERNLELWRQLWRVIEQSDIVVQIVDARNPLLFRSADLERYVKESGVGKQNLLLVNKADMLNETQLALWREYFRKEGITAVFWSAIEPELSKIDEEEDVKKQVDEDEDEDEAEEGEDEDDGAALSGDTAHEGERASHEGEKAEAHADAEDGDWETDEEDDDESGTLEEEEPARTVNTVRFDMENAPLIDTPEQLVALLKQLGRADAIPAGRPLVVGMVGYPNVGKSSTINRVLGHKKVAVSSTPGKTRHLQTLHIDPQLTFCDCPGLVMPSFVFSREEMLLNGILPVDHMRDSYAPIGLLTSRVPRHYLEHAYGVMLPKPAEHESPDRIPTAYELLTAIAFMRGFMSTKGVPDASRAARLLIKDITSGKLKWIAAPPGVDQAVFDASTYPPRVEGERERGTVALEQMIKRRLVDSARVNDNHLNAQFFAGAEVKAHLKTAFADNTPPSAAPSVAGSMYGSTASLAGGKPWKKHNNKHKKEKLRRVYVDFNGAA
uniref:Large subunit GTPase 1 homolog n=1 Tax=Plectus sambesii TaxID=2011161 RepID=A0A914WU47_9BILA